MLWILLILSILFPIYVYVGYPAILYILRKNSDIVIPELKYIGDISIIMVVCNEEKNIEKKINNLLELNYSGGSVEIYIVDDASNDNTLTIAQSFGDKIKCISSQGRLGKSNGLNLAMSKVTTELVMMVDCRQELDSNVLINLSSWFKGEPSMGAVSGELMFKSVGSNDFSSGMDGYWKYEKFIRSSEAIIGSVPGVTGALYMLRVSSYRELPVDTLLDDVQIPMIAASLGYKVGFDARAIAWDTPSVSLGNEKRRKIRTLSGNYQLLQRFPFWVLPFGHPIWWQFFSHKIARLIAPFSAIFSLFLGLILTSRGDSIALLYTIMFISGLSIYPILRVFPVMNKIGLLKLVSSFITLNWFCILAFLHYFSGIQSGSWKK